MRIPVSDYFSCLYRSTIAFLQYGTVGQLITFALTTRFIGDCNLPGTRYCNQISIRFLCRLQIMDTNSPSVPDLHTVYRSSSRRRSTNMESTHRQLRSWLTDGLCGNNADSLTNINQMTTTKIAPITKGTDPIARIAGNRTPNQDFINPKIFQLRDPILVNHCAPRNQYFVLIRIHDIFCYRTSEHPVTQRFYHVAAFDDRSHKQTFFCSTIHLSYNKILGDINQSTSQVTRVCSLERSVRETLTSTMGRNKILHYRQTLTEVRSNRCFDNRSIRLGH